MVEVEDASNHVRALPVPDGSTAVERVGRPAAILAGMRIALLGLGLIGGSVARALRDPSAPDGSIAWSIASWTPSGRGPAAALEDGIIDRAADSPESAIEGADLIVLAGPAPD
jgi:prephenate dehydrogenase